MRSRRRRGGETECGGRRNDGIVLFIIYTKELRERAEKRLTGESIFGKVNVEPLESGRLSTGNRHHYGETGQRR